MMSIRTGIEIATRCILPLVLLDAMCACAPAWAGILTSVVAALPCEPADRRGGEAGDCQEPFAAPVIPDDASSNWNALVSNTAQLVGREVDDTEGLTLVRPERAVLYTRESAHVSDELLRRTAEDRGVEQIIAVGAEALEGGVPGLTVSVVHRRGYSKRLCAISPPTSQSLVELERVKTELHECIAQSREQPAALVVTVESSVDRSLVEQVNVQLVGEKVAERQGDGWRFEVVPGNYKIVVEAGRQYMKASRDVRLDPGQEKTVTLLVDPKATLKVDTPRSALVSVNGQEGLGQDSFLVAPRCSTSVIVNRGQKTYYTTVTLEPGESRELRITPAMRR